jgi:hypothetical protein
VEAQWSLLETEQIEKKMPDGIKTALAERADKYGVIL